jgi:hypothetical protein
MRREASAQHPARTGGRTPLTKEGSMADTKKRRGRLTLADRLAPVERAIATHRKKLAQAIDRRARIVSEAEADAKNRMALVQSVKEAVDE